MSLHSDTISLFQDNRPLLLLLKCCELCEEAANTNLIVFGFTRQGLEAWNTQSTTLEASNLTITHEKEAITCITMNKIEMK